MPTHVSSVSVALNKTFAVKHFVIHGVILFEFLNDFLQSFWNLIVNFTHKDVLHELEHLSQIHTNVGKCRVSTLL